jgi:hypothetical protein
MNDHHIYKLITEQYVSLPCGTYYILLFKRHKLILRWNSASWCSEDPMWYTSCLEVALRYTSYHCEVFLRYTLTWSWGTWWKSLFHPKTTLKYLITYIKKSLTILKEFKFIECFLHRILVEWNFILRFFLTFLTFRELFKLS